MQVKRLDGPRASEMPFVPFTTGLAFLSLLRWYGKYISKPSLVNICRRDLDP
jgi:hypothetical protein